jgi:anthranilate phosphoribosyltransferase
MQLETILEILYQGQTLTRAQAHFLFQQIMQGNVNNEQMAGALIALKSRGETVEEIAGAASATIENAQPFASPDYVFADIVGTGGDGHDTINISTASSIVATAMGLKIAKHGNRSVSSKSGSSDVLTALGIDVTMSATQARQALDEIGLCFLFAPNYHHGFKHAVPVRQALKTRTLFNILGPLVNPARPKHQLLGVYAPNLIQPYAETVKALGHQHTIVVYGAGLDEVAVHGKTDVAEIKNGEIRYYSLTPADFGLDTHPLEALKGGSPQENAEKLKALLQGNGEPAHIDAVAANVALLMKLFGFEDLKANAQQVKQTLATGSAMTVLQQLSGY